MKDEKITNPEVADEATNTAAEPQNEQVTANADETADMSTTEQQAELEKQVAELDAQVADLKDKNLRMMAEYDNYRRRTSQEKLNLKDATQDDMLREFLPLVDDFDRAMAAMHASDDMAALREGMELIYSKVAAYLEKYGVKPIQTENQNFDVELHEAIAMLPAPDAEHKGKIIDCVKKGYTRNDKVLRHAQVAVGE